MESSDLSSGLVKLFTDFQSTWFLGLTTLCYLSINILRGKAGFQIPYVTAWLEKQSKEAKTYVVVLFFALAGFFASFGAAKVDVFTVFSGIIQGISFGVATIGTRNLVKQGMEGVQAYKENKKTDANTDQNGSTT